MKRTLVFTCVVFAIWSYGFGPTNAQAALSDDFAPGILDPQLWTLHDPLGDVFYDVDNGLLTLNVPGGVDHTLGRYHNSSIRLLQRQADTGLYIEAKFESCPDSAGQYQGLIAAENENHEVRFEYHTAPSGSYLTGTVYQDGLVRTMAKIAVVPRDSLFLRMNRWQDLWRLYESPDGLDWSEVMHFTHPLTLQQVGITVGNVGYSTGSTHFDPHAQPTGDKHAPIPAAPLEVVVDYFFNVWSPIDPEDGALFGYGERTFDDLQSLYLFRAGSGAKIFDYAPETVALNLDLSDPAAVAWLPGGGLALHQPTLAVSAGSAGKITEACRASGEMTFEAWVDPATLDQSGPARIMTISGDPSVRNATLAHGLWADLPTTVFDARLRTTTTSDNGQPDTYTDEGSLTGDLQHVVLTFDAGATARLYLDGDEAAAQVVGGTLDNWEGDFPLALGGEVDGSRHWLGTLRLAAAYSRALTPEEIGNNFLAGPDGGDLPPLAPAVSLEGVLPGDSFFFDETLTLKAAAGDADGTVTRVDFMVGDRLLATDTTAPYEVPWNDPPVGTHLVRAVAIDDDSLEAASATVPILVETPASYTAATFLSDDFRGLSLNPYWSVDDLTSGAVLTEADGHFHVDLPEGGDPWDGTTPHVFIHQDESDVPLALEVKLATADFQGDAWGGLHVTDDLGGAFRLVGRRSGGAWTLEWSTATGGIYGLPGTMTPAVDDTGLWLQLRREGSAWTILHSVDGLHYTVDAVVTATFPPARAGWVAGALSGAAAVAADYMFNLATPIIPEDGGSGDQTPPAIQDLRIEPELDRAAFTWQTDEPAHARLAYGLTEAYELGLVVGDAFGTGHALEITELTDATAYHFRITCIDSAGNVATTGDRDFYTDLIPSTATGPEAGDVYREAVLVIGDDSGAWRVTDPDAANPGAAEFLPNPVLSLDLPDLTGAVRAELILDRWGGHPGTSRKRVRFNEASWLHLPEPPIPDASPQCYVYQDNPMIELPLDQLRAGSNTLEGTADRQTCSNFDWGQWGWYGAVVRIYYEGATGFPSGAILQPASGDTIVDLADVVVDPAAPGGIEEVLILARYDGYDSDGDGIFNEWHRTYRRDDAGNELRLLDVVGSLEAAPWSVAWDVAWVPEQQPGTVALQARIKGDDGLWFVTDHVTGLSIEHTGSEVHLYALQDVPRSFWVREAKTKSATFTIPPEHDLARVGSVRMVAHTWNGADAGVIDLNGLWSTSNLGRHHFWERDERIVPSTSLVPDVNTVTIAAATTHHGMEVLWPGPMVMARYDDDPQPAAVSGETALAWGDVRRVDEHLEIPLRLETGRPASFELVLGADDPDLLAGLTSTLDKWGDFTWGLEDGQVTARFQASPGANLPRELLTLRITPHPTEPRSLWGQASVDGRQTKALARAAIPALPARFDLKPNRPNPFNPRTRIEFALPKTARVDLSVHDLQGRLVRRLVTETLPFGIHTADWDGRDDAGRNVASGTYFYRLQAGPHGATGKMLLVR